MVWKKVYRLYDIPLSSLFGPVQQYMYVTPLCIVHCIWHASPMHDTGLWYTCYLPLEKTYVMLQHAIRPYINLWCST